MTSASALRHTIETALARRIPAALTPIARTIHQVESTGVPAVDAILNGGIPLGAITEVTGPECSGRTSLALATVASITAEGKVAAWIDVSDALHPESAAATGIDLRRLLWVRCGAADRQQASNTRAGFSLSESYFTASPAKKGLHGGGFGPHPRTEEKGLSAAVSGLLASAGPAAMHARSVEPQPIWPPVPRPVARGRREPHRPTSGPLGRISQALRVTDLLLQTGGFGAIVIDFAGIAPEHVTRVPAATWFRYRAAADKTRSTILLLTQHACTQSSAALVLRLQSAVPMHEEPTIFSGLHHTVEVVRQRFGPPPGNVTPMRKPPQSERHAEDATRVRINGRRADWPTRPTWIPRAAPQ